MIICVCWAAVCCAHARRRAGGSQEARIAFELGPVLISFPLSHPFTVFSTILLSESHKMSFTVIQFYCVCIMFLNIGISTNYWNWLFATSDRYLNHPGWLLNWYFTQFEIIRGFIWYNIICHKWLFKSVYLYMYIL